MPKKGVKRVTKAATTIDDMFNAFIREKTFQGRSEKTLVNYNLSFELYKNYNGFIGSEPCAVMDEDSIYKLQDGCVERGVSVASQNHYLRDMRAIVYYGMEQNLIEEYKVNLISEQETEPKFYSKKEIEILLAPPMNEDNYCEVRTWVIVNLICATGARIGTICELKVEDVDLSRGIISYRHTKNKKYMSIPITPALLPILRSYISEWRDGEEWLFVNFSGEQLTPNANRIAFGKYCDERGVDSRGVHQLRHSFSREFILQGGNPFQLMTALGHYDIAMSKKYARIWGEDLKEGFAEYTLLDNMKSATSRAKGVKRNNRR